MTHHFLDLSLGAGFLGMRKSARIGCMSHRAEGGEEGQKRGGEWEGKGKEMEGMKGKIRGQKRWRIGKETMEEEKRR